MRGGRAADPICLRRRKLLIGLVAAVASPYTFAQRVPPKMIRIAMA
jgi:hypothetical protein